MNSLRPARLAAQLLAGPPARDVPAVAERLLAIQAQDPRGARLAVRARTHGVRWGDVDRALTEERSVVITWLCRGTLHMVRAEDYFWLHALTTPQLVTGIMRRLAQEEVTPGDAERAIAAITRSLTNEGPLTRAQLRDRVEAEGVRTNGQALVHILALSSAQGVALRGPMAGRQHAYALVRDWLGDPPAVDRERALGELARRYLAGHGPASDRDLARWAGLPLRDARAGLSAVSASLDELAGGLVDLAGRPAAAATELPPPRLLGAYEPALLGWRAREWLVGEHDSRLVAGGVFRPFALVRGRAAAAWRLAGGDVVIDRPFVEVSEPEARALDRDGEDVRRFLN